MIYRLFTFVLGCWAAGAIVLVLLAISDVVFSDEHSFATFVRRLLMSVLWPLALFTSAGRTNLFTGFRSTQGV
jgi:hypothetical protein